jgi:putative membrane protein
MAQKEDITNPDPTNLNVPLQPAEQEQHFRHYLISKKVTDHLANERTFLAWIRTGLSIIAFGFVVERFGLLLREINPKVSIPPIIPIHYSTLIGITLIFLGIAVMIVALLNFLQARRAIDKELFHPHRGFAVFLTVLTCIIGVIVAVYMYFET